MASFDLSATFMSQSFYAKKLHSLLPKEAFLPDPYKLLILVINLAILGLGFTMGRQLDQWPKQFLWAYLPFAVVMGNSIVVLLFGTHDLLHGSVLRRPKISHWLVCLCFSPQHMPPTLWKVLHNRVHHNHTNGMQDPDRNYRYQEPDTQLKKLADVFMPSLGKPVAVLPLLLPVGWIIYTYRNLASVLLFNRDSVPFVPAAFAVKTSERRIILAEWLLIMSLHLGVIAYLQFQPMQVLLAYGLPMALGHAGMMMYIFTNHLFCPMTAVNDPLANSVSVEVPKLLDILHFNFSYHVEHHIFPALNSDYYPQVRELLQQHFPERTGYVIPLTEAWRRLFNTPNFYLDDTTLTDWSGSLAIPCPGPKIAAAEPVVPAAEPAVPAVEASTDNIESTAMAD
jgi:fatty acid desaturase